MAGGHGGARPGAGRKPNVLKAKQRAMTQDAELRQRAGYDANTPLSRAMNETRMVATTTESGMVTASTGKFQDAFVNYQHNLGIGANNILNSSTSSFAPLTRIRVELEWMYRGQFVCKNAVDVVADDMTREGVTLKGEIDPKDMMLIENAATQLAIWDRANETIKWSRLYGGCVAFMLIDGQDPSTPLNMDRVGKGQFKGLKVLDRWMIDPSLEDLVTDMSSPQLGLPKFYRITADAPALPRLKIHHSRVIRLSGNKLPYWQALQENLWGLSVLETIQDRIQAFDLGSTGAAQLIDKSFILTFKVKGLRSLIGSNNPAYEGLQKYVEVMRAYQGIEGMTLMDSEDEYEGHEHGSFSGLAEIIEEFRQQLSGALGIPQTKLFGTSPAGMNATGESDIRNYYDMIRARQVADLLVGMTMIYRMIAQSLGIKLKPDFGLEFKPLWQPTETEKSEIASRTTDSILKAEESGIISTQTAAKELKQLSHTTGVFTNITQDDIDSAADVPVPMAELEAQAAGTPPAPEPNKPAPDGGKTKPKKTADGEVRPISMYGETNMYEPGRMPSGVRPGVDLTGDGAPGPRHLDFHGLPLHVENQKGTTRRSRDPLNPWQAIMAADYGYIVGTGSAEGEHEGMDCFVGPDRDSDEVFVINQRDLGTSEFDEHKVMLGFPSQNAAISAYVSSYSDLRGMDRIMSIRECHIDQLKRWLETGDLNAPYDL
jgi:phage-related protein (TIGR01555 family)